MVFAASGTETRDLAYLSVIAVQVIDRLAGLIDLFEDAARMLKHHQPCLGRADPTMMAGEQRDTEFPFQLTQLLRQSRLGNMHALRGPADMSDLCDC
ncbi:hypothetical protein BI364_11090 [Acidihalobacter yilgarnensis]|uniref:Uncharacterized protein n=1 Tax=Acidihalobacter yilgarnensis TaxID=2819280 RepID=A0A1D8IPJ8_9GAMM|nr:hypothetical protein BI364_11090 [Acidihalobacter yilgarnensis]